MLEAKKKWSDIKTIQWIMLQQWIDINNLVDIGGDKEKINAKVLWELIKTLEKEYSTDISKKIFEFIENLWFPNKLQEAIDLNQIDLEWAFFITLTKESKKKVVEYKFDKVLEKQAKDKFWEQANEDIINDHIKKEKTKLQEKLTNVINTNPWLISNLKTINAIDQIVYNYLKYFIQRESKDLENNFTIDEIQSTIQSLTKKQYDNLFEGLAKHLDQWLSQNIFWEDFFWDNSMIIQENWGLPDKLLNKSEKLLPTNESEQKWFSSIDMHFRELDSELGLKILWETKFKKIYRDSFYSIAKKIINEVDAKEIKLYNLYTSKLLDLDETWWMEDPNNQKIMHHVIERDIKDIDFNEAEDLYNIWLLLKEKIPDFNLHFSPQRDYTIKAITTMEWDIKYRWSFVANHWFYSTNLLVLENNSTIEKRLRLALDASSISQDEFIYLSTQISYYLKHKKFIDKKQLYTEIYHRYNLISYSDTELYDIKVFGNIYQRVIEDIIWPLSIQYKEEFGNTWKPKNTVLGWVHWTGKSQILFNIIKNRIFEYWGLKLNLNAVTINMSVRNFMNMITDYESAFKRKLSSIYENTWLPILIIIEDLDSGVNENDSGMATQSMTTFFDWVGSIPVSLVTATNYPEKISPRLLRPNRLENIIMINMPLSEEERRDILNIHLKKNELGKNIEIQLLNEFMEKFIKKAERFTSSHLWAFIKKIKDHIDFRKKIDSNYKITKNELIGIYNKFLLWKKGIEIRQKRLEDWYDSLKITNGESLWYTKLSINTER